MFACRVVLLCVLVWRKLWWAIFLGEFVRCFVRLCLTVCCKLRWAVVFCRPVYTELCCCMQLYGVSLGGLHRRLCLCVLCVVVCDEVIPWVCLFGVVI